MLHGLDFCDVVFHGQLLAKRGEKDLLGGRSWRLEVLHCISPHDLEVCLSLRPLVGLPFPGQVGMRR